MQDRTIQSVPPKFSELAHAADRTAVPELNSAPCQLPIIHVEPDIDDRRLSRLAPGSVKDRMLGKAEEAIALGFANRSYADAINLLREVGIGRHVDLSDGVEFGTALMPRDLANG